ncbi:MAG TPA: VWA domain-containing protein, partial [Desulfobacterales bacterium]|nr:VWA domain-containing protein [Desulfobacterales bacterium]
TKQARRALNVAVVIDRSGSMSGGKLEDVKEAARTLFQALGPADVFSLAAFDSSVYPVLPPGKVAKIGAAAKHAIDGLHTGSSTNLCGGYEQGGLFAVQASSPEITSRVLLLTDGLANQGITEPAGIAAVVDRYRSLGIGTSTVGVGSGYNEELLGLMAERGGGATYFLRSASEAPAVFSEELGDLFSIDAGDIRVQFVPEAAGLRVGQLNTYAVDADGGWRIGDLFGSQPRYLVLEISSGPLAAGPDGRIVLGRLEIRYRKAVDAGFEAASATLPVSIALGSKEELASLRPDREVTLQAAFLLAARAIEKSLSVADGGGFDEAAGVLETCAAYLGGLALGDAALDAIVADLGLRAGRMRNERGDFYNPMERKSMYTRHQHLSKSHHDKLASMEARHGRQQPPAPRGPGRGAGRRETFRCYAVNGHLLAEIGQDRVLIDTGSPISVGNRSSLELLGHEHPLKPTYEGATVDSIGSLVGTLITVLLGSDIMARYDVRIDLDAAEIEFSEVELQVGPDALQLEYFQGVPIVAATVGGTAQRFFFDTGAKLSYLHS